MVLLALLCVVPALSILPTQDCVQDSEGQCLSIVGSGLLQAASSIVKANFAGEDHEEDLDMPLSSSDMLVGEPEGDKIVFKLDKKKCIVTNIEKQKLDILPVISSEGCTKFVVTEGSRVPITTAEGKKCWDVKQGINKRVMLLDCNGGSSQMFEVESGGVIRWSGDTHQSIRGRWNQVYLWSGANNDWDYKVASGGGSGDDGGDADPAPATDGPDPSLPSGGGDDGDKIIFKLDKKKCIVANIEKQKLDILPVISSGRCTKFLVTEGSRVPITTADGKQCWDVKQGTKKRVMLLDCNGGSSQMFEVESGGIIQWSGDTHQSIRGQWNQVYLWWGAHNDWDYKVASGGPAPSPPSEGGDDGGDADTAPGGDEGDNADPGPSTAGGSKWQNDHAENSGGYKCMFATGEEGSQLLFRSCSDNTKGMFWRKQSDGTYESADYPGLCPSQGAQAGCPSRHQAVLDSCPGFRVKSNKGTLLEDAEGVNCLVWWPDGFKSNDKVFMQTCQGHAGNYQGWPWTELK